MKQRTMTMKRRKARKPMKRAKAPITPADMLAAGFTETLSKLGEEIYRVEYARALDSVIADLKRARARIR